MISDHFETRKCFYFGDFHHKTLIFIKYALLSEMINWISTDDCSKWLFTVLRKENRTYWHKMGIQELQIVIFSVKKCVFRQKHAGKIEDNGSRDMKLVLNSYLEYRFPFWWIVMSGIAGIDTWYRYRYRYLGIERGIDT